MSELQKYVSGQQAVAHADRQLVKQAKKVYDDVRLAAFKADGAVELGKHIMAKIAELDAARVEIAKDDPVRNMAMAEIEMAVVRQVLSIQKSLDRGWGL
jgi:hypothetical protein